MLAGNILTNVAVLFLAAAVFDDLRQGDRLTPTRKTRLLVAAILSATGVAIELFF
jgi:hypothetical protein